MTALSITAANVKPGTGARTVQRLAGVTITAGDVVYRNSSNAYKLALASNATAAAAEVDGIALTGSSAGQPCLVQTGGTIDGMGATEGVIYVLGADGAIDPVADQATNDYVTVLGVGDADGGIVLAINISGAQA